MLLSLLKTLSLLTIFFSSCEAVKISISGFYMRCPLTAFETRLIFNLWKLVCGMERYREFSGHKYNHTKKVLWLEKQHDIAMRSMVL